MKWQLSNKSSLAAAPKSKKLVVFYFLDDAVISFVLSTYDNPAAFNSPSNSGDGVSNTLHAYVPFTL